MTWRRDARSLWEAASSEAAAWAVGEERRSSGVFLRGLVAGALVGAAIAGSRFVRQRAARDADRRERDDAAA